MQRLLTLQLFCLENKLPRNTRGETQMTWKWTRTITAPDDVLSAMDTMTSGGGQYEAILTADWNTGAQYLEWAKACLKEKSAYGNDAAVCYSKRAVCRMIDSMMLNNHLNYWLGDQYPKKLEMLTELGIFAPSIVHKFIIGPRNEVEHTYRQPTDEEARHAVELGELFLGATDQEGKQNLIVSYNWSISYSGFYSSKGAKHGFRLDPTSAAMVIVDVTDAANHEVLVLRPSDAEVLVCPMREFKREQAVEFAKRMRKQGGGGMSGSHTVHFFNELKAQLCL